MAKADPLHFHVDPHIVEDLGVNLYTTLPRVLIEFLANAYDADSPDVSITADFTKILRARNVIRAEHKLELQKAQTPAEKAAVAPLERKTLPPENVIIVQDSGHGMSMEDLQLKYLIIGRRRRDDESSSRTPKGRLVMGRKGLGKLAAFGVAHQVQIVSKRAGESAASKITLDYDVLRKVHHAEDVTVEAEIVEDGGGLGKCGTRITLSRLVFESVSNEETTIKSVIGSAFSLIESEDFVVNLNSKRIEPAQRKFVYAYPEPTIDENALIDYVLKTEDEDELKFQYRIRFTGPGQQLDSHERGVRVYAHSRIASMPDLFGIRTGIHGYQNTHYLDGKVVADFIDDKPIDYISTDRQTLRWETPLLAPLRSFLKDEMEKAIKGYQSVKDVKSETDVKADTFTQTTIEKSTLPKHRKRAAYRIAAAIAASKGDSTADPFYKRVLPILVNGLSQGDILATIAQVAEEGKHDIHRLMTVLTRLTAQEFDEFSTIVHGRIQGISALESFYRNVDFKAGKNEADLHDLFKKNPWLIDPTFTQFLTSNTTEADLNVRLVKELEIDDHPPAKYDKNSADETDPLKSNKRPDLVFLISSTALGRVVIVELKAPNTPLHLDHLNQLKGYIRRAEAWLKKQGGAKKEHRVEGLLIGSMGEADTRADKQLALDDEIQKYENNAAWKVYDIGVVLERTKQAHQEILDVYQRAAKGSDK